MKRVTIDFGIDLGTTNSTIAVISEIDAKVIPNKAGSGITPSAVWIDKRGSLHVGQEAKLRALVDDQDNGDLEFKLRMGMGPDGKKVFARSGREMLPEELSAEVLKSLKIDVQTNMGEELAAAVITVPAAFEQPQTAATQKAAMLAGLGRSTLLLEPVAASLAYGFQSESENVYWFVYDFGGGTFDAAVMRIRDGLIQVVNHDGDNFLGGKLIDWDIVTKVLAPALAEGFNLPDFRRGNKAWKVPLGKLKYYAEQAKIEVCRTRAPHEIFIEDLCEDADGKTVDFVFSLTPEMVAKVSQPWIEKSLGLCRNTLQHCNLKGTDMARIILVGGTTLNPWVREAVQTEFGKQLEFGIDPVTVVARGAAIFASTQAMPAGEAVAVPAGTWSIKIEHKPVGNVQDPDIGGRVTAPAGASVEGCTVEFIDTKTRWRSGRIRLGPDGVFMTQLWAEKQRRHEYVIELCDPQGSRLATSGDDAVSYTLGVVPEENPPAARTIGVGLANGTVALYIKKGRKLPARESMDHFSTIPLRSGHAEDVLRIPVLEGEHPRAERNHGIGTMEISGAMIKRDLPSGSQIELTLVMDASQQVKVRAYVNVLDEEFDATYDPQMKHNSPPELRRTTEEQRKRLRDLQEKCRGASSGDADAVLSRIEDQQLVGEIDSLSEAAESDPDAVTQLDRRLRDLASALDAAEDALEFPLLLQQAESTRVEAEKIVEAHGEPEDRSRLKTITNELKRAIAARDADLVRRHVNDLNVLHFAILERQPGFHVASFEWLVERLPSMRDRAQAEQVIAQGRRAIANNDVDALKAANRQLISMLPREAQEEARHANIGDTITRR